MNERKWPVATWACLLRNISKIPLASDYGNRCILPAYKYNVRSLGPLEFFPPKHSSCTTGTPIIVESLSLSPSPVACGMIYMIGFGSIEQSALVQMVASFNDLQSLSYLKILCYISATNIAKESGNVTVLLKHW